MIPHGEHKPPQIKLKSYFQKETVSVSYQASQLETVFIGIVSLMCRKSSLVG